MTSRKTLCNSVQFIVQLVMKLTATDCTAMNIQLIILFGTKEKSRYIVFALLNA